MEAQKVFGNDMAELNNAVRSGSIEHVGKMLESLTVKYKEGHSLYWFVECGGGIINHESGGLSPIMVACQQLESQHMIEFLVEKGADVNLGYKGGDTVLINAVRGEFLEAVECLLDLKHISKLNLDQFNGHNESALMIACKQGNLELVELLLKHGAKTDGPIHKVTPLMLACEKGSLEIVQQLLKNGADVNVNCSNFLEPTKAALIIACNLGNLQMVELLLGNGADVNMVEIMRVDHSSFGERSPLVIAMEKGHSEMVKALLNRGAKIINKYRLPFEYPSRNLYSMEVSKVLLENRIDCVLSNEGETPLLMYTASGQVELVKLCLDMGHDVNKPDNCGIYPLWRAVDMGNDTIFQLLLAKKAEGNKRPNDRKSAFEKLKRNHSWVENATKKRNYKFAEFLLEKGAQFQTQDSASLQVRQLFMVCSFLI